MAYPNPYDQQNLALPGFGGPAPTMPPAPGMAAAAPGAVGPNGRALGPKMAGYGAAAATPAAAPAAAGPKKAKGPLKGEAQIEDFLTRTIRGDEGAFNPQFMEGQISNALAARSSDMAGGQGDAQRQLAQSGLAGSPAGAALMAQAGRSAASDFSGRIGDLYSQKAQSDFAGKMGALGPYQGLLAQRAAQSMAGQQLAEQRRQFDINQANRGGGSGGPSADDMLLQMLMQNEGSF